MAALAVVVILFFVMMASAAALILVVLADAVKRLAAARAGDVGRIDSLVKIDLLAALRALYLIEHLGIAVVIIIIIVLVVIIVAASAVTIVIVTIALVVAIALVIKLINLSLKVAEIMIKLVAVIVQSRGSLLKLVDLLSHLTEKRDHIVDQLVLRLRSIEVKALAKPLQVSSSFGKSHCCILLLEFQKLSPQIARESFPVS